MIYTRYLIGLFLLPIHIVKIIIGEYFTMDWILIYWSRLGFIICSFFVVGCYLTPLRWKYNRIWFGFITLLHQTYFAVNYYSKSEICNIYIYKILIRSVAQIGNPLENATTIKIFRFSFSVDILKVYCNTFLYVDVGMVWIQNSSAILRPFTDRKELINIKYTNHGSIMVYGGIKPFYIFLFFLILHITNHTITWWRK